MPFFFLHPFYLAALIATSVPFLIHLLNRRRLKRIRFPAVRFILLSQRRIARSYRLRHWFLLALRTLTVLLLVLLLAHPIFRTGIGLYAGGRSLSTVLILDNSLSMDWSREGHGLKGAKGVARRLISSLQEGGRTALLPTNGSPARRVRLTDNRESLLRELDGIGISAGTADFSAALRRAYELLKEPGPQKALSLITDMALTGWDRFSLASLGQYDPRIPLKIIDVGDREKRLNATIKELRIRKRRVAVGLPIDLDVQIVNFSDQKIQDLPVQLTVDGRERERKLITLPPRGESGVSFRFKLNRPGSHEGHVMLKKAAVAGNPKAYFAIQTPEKLKVLIVDGDPKTSLIRSEAFYLTRALDPTGEKDASLFLPTVIIPESLNSVSLKSYQALILCNVPRIPEGVVPRLREYLAQGGGLLFFLGDRVDGLDYNRKLFRPSPPLLPAQLRDRRVLPQSKGEKIAKVEATRPALEGIDDRVLTASLKSTRIHGYFRTGRTGGSTLLTLANGDPLLIGKEVGKGRVLLLTTAADGDWSDLPFKTAYLPLVQSLALYLSGSKGGSVDTGITAGSTKTFALPPSYTGRSIRVVKPDHREIAITFAAARGGASASFQENDLAGIYRLIQPGPRLGQPSIGLPLPPIYAVNPPFLESRLRKTTPEELRAKLRPIGVEFISAGALERGGTEMDLSPLLLIATAITLAGEGWLAQRVHHE